MIANLYAEKTTDEGDNSRELTGNGRPEQILQTKEASDEMANKDLATRLGKTKYRAQGSSLGNRILIAIPVLHIVLSLLFVIGSYFYARDVSGTSFMEQGNNVPFISELGDKQPQSSLFTFGLVLTSFTSLGIVATRFFQVKHFFVKYDGRLNVASLVVGMVFILGKVMTACFQQTSQRAVHFTAAAVYVLLASVYAVIQTFITYKNRTLYCRRENLILLLRLFCTLGMISGTILFLVFLLPDLRKYNKSGKSVSQGGEWFFVVCKMLFMLSFVSDFWYLHPRWLLIKPNNETLSDLVLSNLNVDNGNAAEPKAENGDANIRALTPITE